MATIDTKTTECPACMEGNNPYGTSTRCVPIPGCKAVSFSELAAGYAVANDTPQVRRLLVANGLVANMAAANSLSQKQIANLLVSYSNTNGTDRYLQLLRQFSPNTSTPNWTNDSKLMSTAKSEIYAAVPQAAAIRASQNSTLSSNDWFSSFLDAIEGSKTSVTAPVITTTTKASPVTIGLIIGGVLVLGIIAYVIVKS